MSGPLVETPRPDDARGEVSLDLAERRAFEARAELSQSLQRISDSSVQLWQQSRPVLVGAALGAGVLVVVLAVRTAQSRRRGPWWSPPAASRFPTLRRLASVVALHVARRVAARLVEAALRDKRVGAPER
jgi:hypothetical protein